MNPLQRLREAGQAVWLDFLRRGLIGSGGLERLVREDALAGVTSNPTIFRKAIAGSADYDEAIREAAGDGGSATEVFYRLAEQDIRAAADVLMPTYTRTRRDHGHVSFELEARLARDTRGSIAEAKELFARFGRENVMIKVPGTSEGVPAVEELTAAGVNVNITLLFSIAAYEAVAEAYIRGLERRLASGEPLDRLSSVASFFVSRVDGKVDAALPHDSPLRGTIAIANAKIAYARFLEIFSGERWERLAAAGARVQKPLWASTGTKNPAYSDVLYVEALVGPNTVNTMPQQTMDAFRDHGRVRPGAVTEGLDGARRALERLAGEGIDLEAITAELLDEGIASFDADFTGLIETVREKLEKARPALHRSAATLGPLEERVRERVAALDDGDVPRRIWRKDHTVWKPKPTEIVDRLGWLHVTDQMRERIPELESFAKQVAAEGYRRAVLLGMGGSSLAAEVMQSVLGTREGFLDLTVLDTTHPAAVAALDRSLDPRATLFLVASKSGETVETLSHYAYFHERVGDGRNFVAITDPGTSLAELARRHRFRATFLNPPDIGGRYSALSLFGLVPAALIGADLHRLLDDAEEMSCASADCMRVEDNPGAWLGAVVGEAALAGRDKLTLVLPPAVAAFGDWAEQLIAESLGKEGKGILPVVGEDAPSAEVYGEDRLFVDYGQEDEPVRVREVSGNPVVRVLAPEFRLGAEFFRWELATAVAGHVLGVNPFDQPDVASAKAATKEILEGGAGEPAPLDDPAEVLATVGRGDYVAILAYLDPTDGEVRARLRGARRELLTRYGVATTLGYGPRYLHSTGQLHKGGPPNGVFLIVVDEGREADVPIPDRPYTFGELLDAQALGDLRSLRTSGRRVARVTLDRLGS